MTTYLRKPPGPAVYPRNSSAIPPAVSCDSTSYRPIFIPRYGSSAVLLDVFASIDGGRMEPGATLPAPTCWHLVESPVRPCDRLCEHVARRAHLCAAVENSSVTPQAHQRQVASFDELSTFSTTSQALLLPLLK